ncbi:MAG: O-methyltransferase, partial [Anaerolineae bacterium]|nr:O-methyltransferase [Anaerolineae bacterium]
AVDEYIAKLLIAPDPDLEAALAASDAAGLPRVAVAPNQGKLLQVLAGALGARRILEVGTLGGYSAIWLARALPRDGRLITLEREPRHADVARANLTRAGLADRVEVRVGLALETLAELVAAEAEPFDLIFIDADKANLPEYFEHAIRLARRGSLIVVDNVVRNGAVIEAES